MLSDDSLKGNPSCTVFGVNADDGERRKWNEIRLKEREGDSVCVQRERERERRKPGCKTASRNQDKILMKEISKPKSQGRKPTRHQIRATQNRGCL